MDTKNIHICDYDYPLPYERIAKFPIEKRDHSKLLIYRKGKICEDIFYRITDYLPKDALMIFNNTKVIQARMHFKKNTGANIEIFLLEPSHPVDYEAMFQTTVECSWLCLIGNLKKWKEGTLARQFMIKGNPVNLYAEYINEERTSHRVKFSWDNKNISFAEILDEIGELPIPPYLNRKTQESDKTTYQTVYSKIKGSVAAPTAGLHFTESVLAQIDNSGIERDEITLHVGAGTFKPVKCGCISDHEMHTEYISVHKETIEKLIQHNAMAIAVGTTSVRTLESLYYMGLKLSVNPNISEDELHINQWEPYTVKECITPVQAMQNILDYLNRNNLNIIHTSTQIIIVPGYEYKVVKMLITNFHQPKSTLLLLVSAFVQGNWKLIYRYALEHGFRFLSYGDSSLLIP